MGSDRLEMASAAERAQLLSKIQQFAEDSRFEEADLVEAEFHRQFGGGRIKGGEAALGFSHDEAERLTRLTFSSGYFGTLTATVTNRAAVRAAA